jgi:hypothetical protein
MDAHSVTILQGLSIGKVEPRDHDIRKIGLIDGLLERLTDRPCAYAAICWPPYFVHEG